MDNFRPPDPFAPEPDEALLAGAERLLHLRHIPPPEGFADRVLARVESRSAVHRGVAVRRRLPAWARALAPGRRASVSARLLRLALATGLCLAILLPGLSIEQQHRRAAAGRQAAQQFELAMRLTQQHLAEAGEHAATWHPDRQANPQPNDPSPNDPSMRSRP